MPIAFLSEHVHLVRFCWADELLLLALDVKTMTHEQGNIETVSQAGPASLQLARFTWRLHGNEGCLSIAVLLATSLQLAFFACN